MGKLAKVVEADEGEQTGILAAPMRMMEEQLATELGLVADSYLMEEMEQTTTHGKATIEIVE